MKETIRVIDTHLVFNGKESALLIGLAFVGSVIMGRRIAQGIEKGISIIKERKQNKVKENVEEA